MIRIPLCAGVSDKRFEILAKAPSSSSSVYRPVVLEGKVIWRHVLCHSAHGVVFRGNICFLCCKMRQLLERRLRENVYRIENPLPPDRQKFVPSAKKNAAFNMTQSNDSDDAHVQWLVETMKDPEALKHAIRRAVAEEREHDRSDRSKVPVDFYISSVSELLCILAARAKGKRAKTPQVLMNILLLHAGKHGAASLRILKSIIPTPDESVVRKEMAKRERTFPVVGPGLNREFLTHVSEDAMLVFPMDGTRIIRVAEPVPRSGIIVGPTFPADCSKWPDRPPSIHEESPIVIENYIVEARRRDQMASEMYVGWLQQSRQLFPFLLFPQPKKNFTGKHLGILILKIVFEIMSQKPNQLFVGFATDAESRSQNAFRTLLRVSPSFLEKTGSKLLKASHWAVNFFVPILGRRSVLIHFTDENHLVRCFVRTLGNTLLLLRLYPAKCDGQGVHKSCGLAHISTLRWLQRCNKLGHIQTQDMDAAVKMNCDGASRIVSWETAEVLREHGQRFEGLLFILEAFLMVVTPYRPAEPRSGTLCIREAIRGITRIRIWRMSLIRYQMRMGVGKSSSATGNFISAASYFALEELAQAVPNFVLFWAVVHSQSPEAVVDMSELNTNRAEFAFGQHRTSNRISGESFTGAQLCHECAVQIMRQKALMEATKSGYNHYYTRKKRKLFSSMNSVGNASQFPHPSTEQPAEHVTFAQLSDAVRDAVDDGVRAGVKDALLIKPWKDLYGSEDALLTQLQSEVEKLLIRFIPNYTYCADHLVSSFTDVSSADGTSIATRMWEHRSSLFELVQGDEEIADPEDERGPQQDEPLLPEEGPEISRESSVEASAFMRSFVRSSETSPLLERDELSWNEWRRLIAEANTFREWISRDRQRRFAAGALPGNVTVSGPRLELFDICIFKTTTQVAFLGAVAAIHSGRDDVRAVSLEQSNVWLSVVQLSLAADNSLVMAANDCSISCYDAHRHLVTILKEGTHFQKYGQTDMRVTERFLELLPSHIRQSRPAMLTEWQVPADRSEVDRRRPSRLALLPGHISALADPSEPGPADVSIVEVVGARVASRGRRMFKVLCSDGTRAIAPEEDVPEHLIAAHDGRQPQRRQIRTNRDTDFDYDDEMDDESP